MRFKKKNILIEGFLILCFFLFLISLIPNENSSVESERIQTFGKNTPEALELKYDVITKDIGKEFRYTKIGEINNKYLSDLVIEKKISNRENSISQELVTLYKKNLTEELVGLSASFIDEILDFYDDRTQRRWRNHLFYFEGEETKFVFYNRTPLLKKMNESLVIGNYTYVVKPYLYERYHFYLQNHTIKTVDVNLVTWEGEEELEKYVDINNFAPKVDFVDLRSEFVESDEEYIFYFYIWE